MARIGMAGSVPYTQAIQHALQTAKDATSVADLLFLEAWELDRSMVDPATLLRIRQIRRANPKLSAEITEELTRRRCKTGAKSAATAVPILYDGIQTRS